MALLTVMAVTGAPEPFPTHYRVVGVLPDGTRYEIRMPVGIDAGEAEAISAIPVWANGRYAGAAVAGTRFSTGPAYEDFPIGEAVLDSRRIVARAGKWTMAIDLFDHSLGREAELSTIRVREQDGLIVVDLPPNLRWGTPGETTVEMEVDYGHFRVVRGCTEEGQCSPGGEVMVSVSDPDLALHDLRIRVR